jgi:hypothetical protein
MEQRRPELNSGQLFNIWHKMNQIAAHFKTWHEVGHLSAVSLFRDIVRRTAAAFPIIQELFPYQA